MKQRILSLVLVLGLLLCSAFAEGSMVERINEAIGFPVTDETISVSIAFVPVGGAIDFKADRNWQSQYISKYSGLDIEWTIIDPNAATERIALMLHSGDMPDAILGYNFGVNDLSQYGGSEGLFYPINELLEYMPNLVAYYEKNPQSKAAVTLPDGNIYSFAHYEDGWGNDVRFFVQTTWLENLGLERPKTLAEFKDMLIAFRDQDANGNGDATDEIPWCGSWNGDWPERILIFNAQGYITHGTNIGIDYSGEETRIIFVPYAELYKDYLLYMRDLWNEKLLDPDMFTQSETQVQATVLEGSVGFVAMSAPVVYDPDHEMEWKATYPLVDNEGDTPVWAAGNKTTSYGSMVLNANISKEKAIALAKLADSFYTDEATVFGMYGPEAGSELDFNGDGHYINAAGTGLAFNRPDNMPGDWEHRITNLTLRSVPGVFTDESKMNFVHKYPDSAFGKLNANGIAPTQIDVLLREVYPNFYVENVPNFFFSAEDLERINELTVPLDDYVKSMEAKFIIGAASIEDDFDEFISTLEKYGVNELLEIYNRYFNDYKAS